MIEAANGNPAKMTERQEKYRLRVQKLRQYMDNSEVRTVLTELMMEHIGALSNPAMPAESRAFFCGRQSMLNELLLLITENRQ